MRKRYFRMSLGSLFLQAMIVAAFGLDVYVFVIVSKVLFSNPPYEKLAIGIFVWVVLLLGFPFLVYLESTFLTGTICLDQNKIYTRGDNRLPNEKIQFKASADYKDILEAKILPFSKNSKGGYLRLTRPIPYLCIKTKQGKNVLFGLHSMSPKTVRGLLVYLNDKCRDDSNVPKFNIDGLMEDFSKARWATEE